MPTDPATGGVPGDAGTADAVRRVFETGARSVVLVEGISDQRALEALAQRRGRDLVGESVAIVAIGGATNLRRFLDMLGPRGFDLKLAGLCDLAAADTLRSALERSGFGSALTSQETEALGFYTCDVDLEDELIRSLGAAAVLRIIATAGELPAFRTFQTQPAQRGKSPEAQIHRFLGTRSGRKARYAELLVNALDLERVPRPLERVLAHA